MAKVVVTANEVIVRVTLALVMTVEVWQKELAAWARRVYLLFDVSKGHISINWAPLHYGKSAATRKLSNY